MKEEELSSQVSMMIFPCIENLTQLFTYHPGGSDQLLVPSNDQTMPLQLSLQQDVAINLPGSLFQQVNDSENVGVFFGRYEAATLFPISGGNTDSSAPRQAQVCSRVLAATVGQNVSIQNLEEPVTVLLRLQNKEGMVRMDEILCSDT